MRPLISYDDITLPYESDTKPPPAKKRKNNHKKARDKEESRELTHNEIWDDSALIDAWDSAKAEYAEYHGDPDSWKSEPVKKSPLWYNIPPDPSTLKNHAPAASTSGGNSSNSQPLDFDTFVPSHNPSLDLPLPPAPPAVPGPDYASHFLPEPEGPMVSADEAFSRALGAMYWGGYWTAMYHCQRRLETAGAGAVEDEEELAVVQEAAPDDEEMAEDVPGDDEELISTQR
ncbi:hypothetical protein BDZ89DRAFT_1107112 [Hymenopellis radicata]|nr:hypothetical protein BDZ89DRAFT_1107112 [Hymenopellis radicata]